MGVDIQKLAKAVTCWLEYESSIGREPLFDESYLAYPVGAFLQVHGDGVVRPEEPHPLLWDGGQGKPPAVDYVLTPRGDSQPWSVAIELKYISDERDFAAELFQDIIRLESIVEKYPAASRYLVLAGKWQHLESLLTREGNVGGGGGRVRLFPSVLSTDASSARIDIDLVQSADPHRRYWKDNKPSKLAGWPQSLSTILVGSYGDHSAGFYVCLAWEVASPTRPTIQL